MYINVSEITKHIDQVSIIMFSTFVIFIEIASIIRAIIKLADILLSTGNSSSGC